MLIYGTVIHAPTRGDITIVERALLVIDSDTGIITSLTPHVTDLDLEDHIARLGCSSADVLKLSKTQFLHPGFIDTHIHAPQYPYAGTGSHVPLMTWLQRYTFPAEAQFKDTDWARQVYKKLVRRLLANGTTTALYFGSLHREATEVLAETCLAAGQRALVGKVCMDQHGSDDYVETTDVSVQETERFIQHCLAHNTPLLTPVVTPRFLPTCSPALLDRLAQLARQYNVPIQSHISESLDELAFVAELYPGQTDAEVFDKHGLLTQRSIMAHGVHLTPDDVDLLVRRGSSVAVCPLSNAYFADGIFPIHDYHIDRKLQVGLGSDVAGGYSPTVHTAVRQLTVASRYRGPPVNWQTGFYLATLGGAHCLGIADQVGTLAPGKAFDAVLVDVAAPDSPIDVFAGYDTWEDIVEKYLHLGDDRNIQQVWVAGRLVHRRV